MASKKEQLRQQKEELSKRLVQTVKPAVVKVVDPVKEKIKEEKKQLVIDLKDFLRKYLQLDITKEENKEYSDLILNAKELFQETNRDEEFEELPEREIKNLVLIAFGKKSTPVVVRAERSTLSDYGAKQSKNSHLSTFLKHITNMPDDIQRQFINTYINHGSGDFIDFYFGWIKKATSMSEKIREYEKEQMPVSFVVNTISPEKYLRRMMEYVMTPQEDGKNLSHVVFSQVSEKYKQKLTRYFFTPEGKVHKKPTVPPGEITEYNPSSFVIPKVGKGVYRPNIDVLFKVILNAIPEVRQIHDDMDKAGRQYRNYIITSIKEEREREGASLPGVWDMTDKQALSPEEHVERDKYISEYNNWVNATLETLKEHRRVLREYFFQDIIIKARELGYDVTESTGIHEMIEFIRKGRPAIKKMYMNDETQGPTGVLSLRAKTYPQTRLNIQIEPLPIDVGGKPEGPGETEIVYKTITRCEKILRSNNWFYWRNSSSDHLKIKGVFIKIFNEEDKQYVVLNSVRKYNITVGKSDRRFRAFIQNDEESGWYKPNNLFYMLYCTRKITQHKNFVYVKDSSGVQHKFMIAYLVENPERITLSAHITEYMKIPSRNGRVFTYPLMKREDKPGKQHDLCKYNTLKFIIIQDEHVYKLQQEYIYGSQRKKIETMEQYLTNVLSESTKLTLSSYLTDEIFTIKDKEGPYDVLLLKPGSENPEFEEYKKRQTAFKNNIRRMVGIAIVSVNPTPKTNQDLIDKVSEFISVLKLNGPKIFKERVENDHYIPENLLNLSLEEMLPEIYDNQSLSSDEIENTTGNLKQFIRNNSISLAEHVVNKVPVFILRGLDIIGEDFIFKLASTIANPEHLKTIRVNDEIVMYTSGSDEYSRGAIEAKYLPFSLSPSRPSRRSDHSSKKYAFSARELKAQFRDGNYINQFSKKPFRESFIITFRQTHNMKVFEFDLWNTVISSLSEFSPKVEEEAPEEEPIEEEKVEVVEEELGNPFEDDEDDVTTEHKPDATTEKVETEQSKTDVEESSDFGFSSDKEGQEKDSGEIVLSMKDGKCAKCDIGIDTCRYRSILYENRKPHVLEFCSSKCFEDYEFKKKK